MISSTSVEDSWATAEDSRSHCLAELFEADVIERVTTRASVEARRTPQSTHPEAVQAALDDMRAWLESGVQGPA